MPIRVVLGEDDWLVREGVHQVLAGADEIEVVAYGENEAAVLAAVEEYRPDVVLTDVRMPPSNSDEGIRIATRLRADHPSIGVVILSQYTEPAYVLALLAPSSDGRAYLLKERVHDRRELVAAVTAVAAGDSVVDPKIIEVLLTARSRAARSPLADLTPREQEVLAAIAEGKSNAAIADEMTLTKRAVEKHVNAIFLKLNLSHVPHAQSISPRVKATLLFLADASLLDAGGHPSPW